MKFLRMSALLMVFVLAFTALAACGDDDDDDAGDDAGSTVESVATEADEAVTEATDDAGDDGDDADDATEEPDDADDADDATEEPDDADDGDDGDDAGAGAGDAAVGEELATSLGCLACHSIDGTQMTGPTWQGLYGSEVTLENGDTVSADDEYIRNSILNPNDQIHEGFPPAMPSFEGQVSDQDIADLIAYIATLE